MIKKQPRCKKIVKSFLFTGVQDHLSFIYTPRVRFPRVRNRVLIKKEQHR